MKTELKCDRSMERMCVYVHNVLKYCVISELIKWLALLHV